MASPVVVSGTADVAEGQAVWLLVRPPDNRYYLAGMKQSLRVDANGAWSSSVGLGRSNKDKGLSYDLLLVRAPVEGEFAALVQGRGARGSGGWDELPDDAARVSSVRVALGGFHGPPLPSPSS